MKSGKEEMKQIIFKIGRKKDITVCISFFPDECGIDGLFEDAISVLCSELYLTRDELFSEVNLDAAKDKLRIVSLKELIKRSTDTTGDPYEAVEIMTNIIPELRKLREGRESYQRVKIRKLEQAEDLALFEKVFSGHKSHEKILKIFTQYSSDIEVRFKLFLFRLSNLEIAEASNIVGSSNHEWHEHELYKAMTTIYEACVTKNVNYFHYCLAECDKLKLEKDKFITVMLMRIRDSL
jgi:hypothetical protein